MKKLLLILSFLTLLIGSAHAAEDGAVCTPADQPTCTGQNMKTNINEELGSIGRRAPLELVSIGGSANSIEACTLPVLSTYNDRQGFSFKPLSDITSAPHFLNICGIGFKSLVDLKGTALPSGSVKANSLYTVAYYGDGDEFRIISPLSSTGTLASTDIDTSAELRGVLSDETGTGAAMFGLTAGATDDLSCTGSQVLRRNAGDTAWECATIAVGGLSSTDIDTSAELRTVLTDETGTGAAVFATSPVLVTPALGTPSSVTLTNATGLPILSGVSGLGTGVASALATPSSANLATALTDETGSGSVVLSNSPTLVTPALGTPSSVTLTNATGLPINTGVSGLGAGVSTFLGTPSSVNLAAALTGETGSGAAVFGTSPTFTTNLTLGSDTISDFTGLGLALASGSLGLNATGAVDEFCMTYESTGPTIEWQACGSFVATDIDTSAELRTLLTDETGTGSAMFGLTSAMADDLTCTGGHFLRRNAGDTAWECAAITGGGDLLAANNLSDVANAATARTNLGVAIGSQVQQFDTDLSTWATVTSSTDGQSLVSSANYASMRALLDLEAGTDFYSISAADSTFLSSTEMDTSAEIRAILTDETGTGGLMFGLTSSMADDLSCTASQVVRRNSGDTAFECATVSGTGDMVAANNLSDVASAATAFGNIKQAASDTATGVVELATNAETVTGTDTARATTPAGVAAAIAAASPNAVVSVSTQVFTSSGTWTKPAGLLFAQVEVQGPGGGSGGCGASTNNIGIGLGGGAGGYSRKLYMDAGLSATETVTLGAVGTGGDTGNNAGTAGGNSVFKGMTANGGGLGSGGPAGNTVYVTIGGAGGTASGGDVNISGSSASIGYRGSGVVGYSSTGGYSVLGTPAALVAHQAAGNTGTGYGQGARGGLCNSITNQAGANGGAAITIVTEYKSQ